LTHLRYATFAAAYLAIYLAIGWTLSGQPEVRSMVGYVALVLPPAALVAVILRRRRQWLGCQRLFWDAFAVGALFWVVGYLGRLVDVMVNGAVAWQAWHTVFTLAGNVAPVVALMARPDRGVRASSTGAVAIVVASYGLLAAFIYVYFVFIPTLVPGAPASRQALATFSQATRALLVAGALAAAMAAWHSEWRGTYLTVAAGAGAGLVVRTLTAGASDSVTAAGTLAGTAWLVPFLAYLWAALDAPPSPLRREVVEAPGGPALLCAVPAFLIPLIGYTVPMLHSLDATADAHRTLLTGVMSIGGLGLLTLRLSTQGGALQRADQRWRLLAEAIEQTGDAIVITRADGSIEHANDAFLRSVGYSREALAALTSTDLIAGGFQLDTGHILDEINRHGLWRGTVVRRRQDGRAFHASCTVVALRDSNGEVTHLVGVERDITDELNLRDQLVHAERLSAIGALVAGIAHEINNPLQTILGTAELLLEEQPTQSGRQELDVVRREASRAAQIVRNLLSFVRRSAPDRTSADLNDIVRSTIELRVYHLERSNIRLDVSLHGAPLMVLVNREEIQQIVLNLILNAEQAIESSGHSGTISMRTFPVGSQQCLEVADDGPGVSRELRGKIFEPFFTTKDVGEGTGLGLSISHGIAFAHGGSLEFCGDQAQGACFRLMLPAEGSAREPIAPPHAPISSRLALVIDDEVDIRRLLGRLLARRGFEVLEADSGDAALALAFDRHPQIILCDMRMPDMNGVEVYSHISAALPQLCRHFAFMSGDSAQMRHEGIADVPILRKPFSASDLDILLQKLA
jgi:PAS domain S-box-containing protein